MVDIKEKWAATQVGSLVSPNQTNNGICNCQCSDTIQYSRLAEWHGNFKRPNIHFFFAPPIYPKESTGYTRHPTSFYPMGCVNYSFQSTSAKSIRNPLLWYSNKTSQDIGNTIQYHLEGNRIPLDRITSFNGSLDRAKRIMVEWSI